MALRSARIAKIENLSKEEQEELGRDSGFAIIEITNPQPKQKIKSLEADGIRGYFLSLGQFQEVDITE